jgi:hypothetical protein
MPKVLFADPLVVGFPNVLKETVNTDREEITYQGSNGTRLGAVRELAQPFDLSSVACAWAAVSAQVPNDDACLVCDEAGQAYGYLLLLNQEEQEIARCFYHAVACTPGGGSSALANVHKQLLTPEDIAPGVTDTVVRKIQAAVFGASLSEPPEEIEASFILPELLELGRVW